MNDTFSLVDVKGYEGMYMVSDDGSVWSSKGKAFRKLKPSYVDGYAKVSLCDGNGGIKKFLVHRLVAEAFLGDCPDGYQVDHADGNRANNDILNLRYVRPSVNCKLGAVRRGCGNNPNGRRGRRVVAWKDDIVLEFPSTREAARCLHRCNVCVSDCCNGIQNTCAGFRMAFADEIALGLVDDAPEEYLQGET